MLDSDAGSPQKLAHGTGDEVAVRRAVKLRTCELLSDLYRNHQKMKERILNQAFLYHIVETNERLQQMLSASLNIIVIYCAQIHLVLKNFLMPNKCYLGLYI